WHASDTARVKTPRQLMDLYYRSVGRGGSLLLNVPPDRRGLIDERDVASLAAFGKIVRETFGENLAASAKTIHRTRDGIREIEMTMPREISFNVVRLREKIELGQRIDAVELDRWANGGWEKFAQATSIGACRLIRLDRAIAAARVRLRITQAAASPEISEFGLFLEAQG
ncbi:MAG TPA: alpha-L-fucosidase, partial [Bryobacteraceae bacterium]|nr:alpha-L-fucosidase [Bryobacteraceae bacterium]